MPPKPAAVVQEVAAVPVVANTVSVRSLLERRGVAEVLLMVAAILTFWPTLGHGFMSFDDGETIYYNKVIQHPTLIGLLTSRIVGMYVPVSAFLYAGVYQLSGEDAFGYHLTSLILHGGVSICAFTFLRKLNLSVFVAFISALLFAVHPVKAEPVCWIAAQTTLVFTLFYLLSLISWVQYRQKNQQKWLWFSLLFFALSALSKSAAVTLPLLLPVLDWYLGVHKRFFRVRQYAYLLPFLLVSISLGAYTFFTRTESGAAISMSNKTFNLFDRLLMVSHTLLFYIYKLIIPLDLTISYPMVKTGGAWTFDYYLAPVVLGGLLYLLYRSFSKERLAGLAAGLYVLPLSIMLPLFSVGTFELRSDRYLYLPSLGVFLLLTHLTERLPKFLKWGLWLSIAAVYAFLGSKQAKYWENDAVCFQQCVDIYPNSITCNCNLAYGELLDHQYEKSIAHYSNVLAMDTTCMECYNGRGQAYFQVRKLKEAYDDFTIAIAAGIVTPKLFLNHGKCLIGLNRPAEAIPDLDRSLELEPKSDEAYYFRAIAQEKTGNLEKALADYTSAINLKPLALEAIMGRGTLQFNTKHYPEAIADFSTAVNMAAPALKPMVYNNRASAYLQTGQYEEAVKDADKALALNPQYANAYRTRGTAYMQLGQTAKGQADLQRAGGGN